MNTLKIFRTIITESSDDKIKCGHVFGTKPYLFDPTKVEVSESTILYYEFPDEFKLDRMSGRKIQIFDSRNNQCTIITKKNQPAIKSPTGYTKILKRAVMQEHEIRRGVLLLEAQGIFAQQGVSQGDIPCICAKIDDTPTNFFSMEEVEHWLAKK